MLSACSSYFPDKNGDTPLSLEGSADYGIWSWGAKWISNNGLSFGRVKKESNSGRSSLKYPPLANSWITLNLFGGSHVALFRYVDRPPSCDNRYYYEWRGRQNIPCLAPLSRSSVLYYLFMISNIFYRFSFIERCVVIVVTLNAYTQRRVHT